MIQMILELIDNNTAITRARIKRHVASIAGRMEQGWRQLELKLIVRRVIKDNRGFVWTRPDGKQFRCRTVRQLVSRIMDYDGYLLKGVMRLI